MPQGTAGVCSSESTAQHITARLVYEYNRCSQYLGVYDGSIWCRAFTAVVVPSIILHSLHCMNSTSY